MNIEQLKAQLDEGKITLEQYKQELAKLLEARSITQEQHDEAAKYEAKQVNNGGQGGGQGGTDPQISPELQDFIQKQIQSAQDKVRTEYTQKLKEKDEQLREKMTDEERRLADLQQREQELEETRAKLNAQIVQNHTANALSESSLSPKFASFLARDTVENTDAVIKEFKAVWDAEIAEKVKEKFKEQHHEPGGTGGTGGDTNPWNPKTRNITEQARLFRDNPAKAKELAGQYGIKL